MKRGSVGQEIFEQIQELVAEEKISRAAAFKRLAETTGRQAGAISTNYYRVARKRGVGARAKKGSERRGTPRLAASAASGLLLQLAEVIRQQEQELEKLRKENSRLGEVRKLLQS